jgi:thiamine kinase-like enzyme
VGDAPVKAVRAALAEHRETRGLADVALEPVTGGLSNHAWRAEQGGRSYFVRLGGPHSISLGVDRYSERTLLEVVAAAGLAPGLVTCDPANGLLVTEFVAGAPWRREDARMPRNVARIGEILRRLHGMPLPSGIRRISFRAQARQLEAQLAAAGVADPMLARIAESAFDVLRARHDRISVCHNDLHHLNVLDDGARLWLVDWEYGGCGDPLFDLASFASQHESTSEDRAVLLEEAYGDAGVAASTALGAACTAFDYVQWLWYRLWVACNGDADGGYGARAAALEARLAAAAH